VLRDRLGLRSPKDGCSPQGQCGCCTVWVDGAARVSCVTPARRAAGRTVTTVDGLAPDQRRRWADAFAAAGASQCGFCTPGIIMRLAALEARAGGPPAPEAVEAALVAHLCRCTGWRTIVEAAGLAAAPTAAGGSPAGPGRDLGAAATRAGIEGGTPQSVGPDTALGRGGFADDSAPEDALVAVPDGAGGWAVGETLTEARQRAGKVQGRRSPAELTWPLDVPEPGPGTEWALRLRTTWVEPAYLETDASWCRPGGEPASPLANGGAFGAKRSTPVSAAARRLADQHGRAVRVLLSREDAVRWGPKRPPVAAGVGSDGSGVMRVVRTDGIAAVVDGVAAGLVVEELDVPGPPTSVDVRAAGWAEAAVLGAVLEALAGAGVSPARAQADPAPLTGLWALVRSPAGAEARASIGADGTVRVAVSCGSPLDEVVLRSYCIGAAHMALGWVRSEGIAVDASGEAHDLTIRSFGILRARDMPAVEVEVAAGDGPPVNGSDAVFAAVAAAAWMAEGLPERWPTRRSER